MNRFGTVNLQFHSWWRTSSGQTNGEELDDMIQRSPEGLPWVPGRTVKGLLRDAALQLCNLGHMEHDQVLKFFGKHVDDVGSEEVLLDARYLTEPGQIRVGSAEMPATWIAWVQGNPEVIEVKSIVDALYDRRAMTAVNRCGVAETGSLRAVEVTAPLALTAPLWIEGSLSDATQIVEKAACFIKAIGAGRNRGFGRVTMGFEAMGDEVS